MAERGEESSDSLSPSSVYSCEDVESLSPSSSSEESANEDEPDASSISRPSGSKRKENDSQPRSKSYRKQQQKKNKKQNFSLNDEEIEKLPFWIFSTQEVAQVEAEIRLQAVSEREQSTKHMQRCQIRPLIAGFCRKFSTLASESCILSSVDEITIKFSIWKVFPGAVNC